MAFLWAPLLLLLGLLPLLVVLYVVGQRRRRPASVRYSSLTLIRAALPRSSFLRRHLPFALFALALAGLGLALARPVVIASVPTNQTTIVLAIDVSGSMCSTDIPPSRIEAAEAAAIQFIEGQGSSTQIGIVAFSGFAAIVQAPTNDRQLLTDAVHSLTTGRRTAVGSGILDAIDAIAEIDPAVAKSITDSTPGVAPVPVPKGAYAPRSSSCSPTARATPGRCRSTRPSRRPIAASASTRSASGRPIRVRRTRIALPTSSVVNRRSVVAGSAAGVRRWRRRPGRLPARDRRGHAQAGRRPDRWRLLPGRERRAARRRLRGPADEPHHQARGRRGRRRVRRVQRAVRVPRDAARPGVAPAALRPPVSPPVSSRVSPPDLPEAGGPSAPPGRRSCRAHRGSRAA